MEENLIKTSESNKPYFWNEISQEEKIERMREIIKHQKIEILRLNRRISLLEHHKHDSLNNVVIDINDVERREFSGDSSSAKGIFF